MATTNNKCKKCGCEDKFLTSPAPCPTPEGCPDPVSCSETIDANCVLYTGEPLQCNGEIILDTGTSLNEAIVNLIEYIQNINHVVCGTACENAYDYMTGYALANATEELPPQAVLDLLLSKGLILPSANNSICCPVCGPYVLASVETYLKFAEAVGRTQSPYPDNPCEAILNNDCCTNVFASVETYLKYAEAVGCTQSAPIPNGPSSPSSTNNCTGCNNGFAEELQTLIDSDSDPNFEDRLLDKGVVESGSLNIDLTSNISNLQALVYAMFDAQEGTNIETVPEIVDRILDKGIVLSCVKGQLALASVETYLKYAEAVGLTCAAAVPA